jgi:long-chain fatty acid transport protein
MRSSFATSAGVQVVLGVLLVVCVSTGARAGGFAIREQSAYFQGTSFAGSAAGGSLSSMFWNSAATAELNGINTSSSYSLVIPDAEVKVDTAADTGAFALFTQPVIDAAPSDSGNIGDLAVVPASYANYQVNDKLFFGVAMNSQYGLATETEEEEYKGAMLGRKITRFLRCRG